MNSIILCEDTTDLIMLQFIMQYKYNWKYHGFIENSVTNMLQEKEMVCDENTLKIKSCGGINNIPKYIRKIQEKCSLAVRKEECYHKVLVMIDNDTIDSKKVFIQQINDEIKGGFSESIVNKGCVDWDVENCVMGKIRIGLSINCIPEQNYGAIEHVMFEALQTDEVEKLIITESNQFIEQIVDKQSRYLRAKSRHAKAGINTYFAIRFPEEKYDERSRILRAFDWENNQVLNNSFNFLEIVKQ